ncbi:MAG: dockerin type I domain-containing protein, partial [candidate division Zixibacteria bacterium]|nr:dockerin type I domain-containing protein [candidate division Zixibacteria bacterium]
QSPEGLTFYAGKLYVCVTGFNPVNFTYGVGKIAVYDTTLDSVVSEIVVGKNPQAIHRDFNGNLQVICTGDYSSAFGRVYTIDPQTESVLDSTYLGGTPGPFGIDWTGVALFAAGGYSTDGWVYALDTDNDSILHDSTNPLLVNLGAGDVTTDKYFRAYVSCFSASTIDVIDVLLDSVVSSHPVGDGPLSVALYDPKPDGDANGDQSLSLADIITIVNFLFKSTPISAGSNAYGDANCDGRISLADAIHLVNYLFKSGHLPCDF